MLHKKTTSLLTLAAILGAAIVSASSAQAYVAESLGGVVRAGPSMQSAQITSLRESEPITHARNTGIMMNGYPWFSIRFRGGQVGYQWGDIMCTRFEGLNGMHKYCPSLFNSMSAKANGFNAGSVFYPGGRFVNTSQGVWIETNRDGNHYFKEAGRDEWSVYLYDQNRSVRIQLDLFKREIFYSAPNVNRRVLYGITGAKIARQSGAM